MENACDALEREFKRITNDLEFVQHRLEAEYRSSAAPVDVMSIFRRMQVVEAKLLAIKEKSHILAIEKQKLFSSSTFQLVDNSHVLLKNAVVQSGCPVDHIESVNVSNFNSTGATTSSEASIPTVVPLSVPTSAAVSTPTAKTRPTKRLSVMATEKKRPVDKDNKKTTATETVIPSFSTVDATSSSATTAAITSSGLDYLKLVSVDKFNALPESTRGRVTHTDVVHAYRQLVQFIKVNTIAPGVEAQNAAIQSKNRRRSSMMSQNAAGGGNKVNPVNNASGASKSKPVSLLSDDSLPVLEYTLRELSVGAVAASNPFQIEKATNIGAMAVPIKLTGKTGSCILLSLRALGLVKMDMGGSASSSVTVVCSDDLETELLQYKQSLM